MISRRQLLASGVGAALFTLNDLTSGALDSNELAAAGPFTLDETPLDTGELAAWPPLPASFEAQDWSTANIMWAKGGYADGAQTIRLPNGDYFATLTVNEGPEGSGELQHTITLHSTDGAATWQQTGIMEPPEAPEASWGTPWLRPDGRLYILYTYNHANLRHIPNNDGAPPGLTRVDSVGVIAYKSSTDNGHTWSERRHLDLPATAIDLRNPWQGEHRMFWMGPGPPVQHDGDAYIGISKMGAVSAGLMYADTEAFIVKLWETTPGVLDATASASIPSGLPNTEEPCPIVFDDGVINTTFRTVIGRLGEAWSTDNGATWTTEWARDQHGAVIAQPRALAKQFQMPDGRFFLWGHNNNGFGTPTGFRNPAFYRIGERVGPRLVWGAPKLLLWDSDPTVRISGPHFLFDDESMLVVATDKVSARVLRYSTIGL